MNEDKSIANPNTPTPATTVPAAAIAAIVAVDSPSLVLATKQSSLPVAHTELLVFVAFVELTIMRWAHDPSFTL